MALKSLTPAWRSSCERPLMTPPTVAVAQLVKRYGAKLALDGLSFELHAGAWVALLGPNGAGKSTLFQILTGLFAADAGEVHVAGHDLRREPVAALRHIGSIHAGLFGKNAGRRLLAHSDHAPGLGALALDQLDQGHVRSLSRTPR